MELSDAQVRTINDKISEDRYDGEVLKLVRKPKPGKYCTKHQKKVHRKCFSCGESWSHVDSNCPAIGQSSKLYHKENHLAVVSRSKKTVKLIEEETSSDDSPHRMSEVKLVASCSTKCRKGTKKFEIEESSEDSYVFKIGKCGKKVNLQIKGRYIKLRIDTCSDVNIVDEKSFAVIRDTVKLKKSSLNLYAYGQATPLKVFGYFTEVIEFESGLCLADFFVVKGSDGSLLCPDIAVKLKLIRFTDNVNARESVDTIIEKFPSVFKGIGKLRNVKVALHTDELVEPVIQIYRRIPFPLREKVEKELSRLESSDVIERVHGPTDWVSPIVVRHKRGGDIRICVDMRVANTAIKRVRNIISTIEEIRHKLNGAVKFSKLDLTNGYHQLELHPSSRDITTFATHVGLYRYRSLN